MIIAWWTSLSVLLKILWGITLVSSLVFIIQSVMTFIGADMDGDLDGFDMDTDFSIDYADLGHSGMNLYTFRNFVNFFLGFGWTSVLFFGKIQPLILLFAIATVVGVSLVAAVMYMFKALSRMQQSGNIDLYKSAVGCHGSVYLRIPAGREGEGKVQISISGSIREYSAVTDNEALPTGTPVQVVEVLDSRTVVVEKQNSLII